MRSTPTPRSTQRSQLDNNYTASYYTALASTRLYWPVPDYIGRVIRITKLLDYTGQDIRIPKTLDCAGRY